MSKQLRYLINCTLYEGAITKQPNGYITESFTKINDFKVQSQEVDDEVSATVYGAKISNMLRLSSPHYALEKILKTKLNESSDNITKYSIVIGSKRYNIVSVKEHWIDVEFANMYNA